MEEQLPFFCDLLGFFQCLQPFESTWLPYIVSTHFTNPLRHCKKPNNSRFSGDCPAFFVILTNSNLPISNYTFIRFRIQQNCQFSSKISTFLRPVWSGMTMFHTACVTPAVIRLQSADSFRCRIFRQRAAFTALWENSQVSSNLFQCNKKILRMVNDHS